MSQINHELNKKIKNFEREINNCLQSFKQLSSWADIEISLQQLQKILHKEEFSQVCQADLSFATQKTLSSRLSQCLSSSVEFPPKIHSNCLKIFKLLMDQVIRVLKGREVSGGFNELQVMRDSFSAHINKDRLSTSLATKSIEKQSTELSDDKRRIYLMYTSDLVLGLIGFYKLANNENKSDLLKILDRFQVEQLGSYTLANLNSVLMTIMSTVEDLTTQNQSQVKEFLKAVYRNVDPKSVYSILWSNILKNHKTALFTLKQLSEDKIEPEQFADQFPNIDSTIFNALKQSIEIGNDEVLILAQRNIRKIENNCSTEINFHLKQFRTEKWVELFSEILKNLYKNEWSVKTDAYLALFQDSDLEFMDIFSNAEKATYIDTYIISAFLAIFTSPIATILSTNESAGANLSITYKLPVLILKYFSNDYHFLSTQIVTQIGNHIINHLYTECAYDDRFKLNDFSKEYLNLFLESTLTVKTYRNVKLSLQESQLKNQISLINDQIDSNNLDFQNINIYQRNLIFFIHYTQNFKISSEFKKNKDEVNLGQNENELINVIQPQILSCTLVVMKLIKESGQMFTLQLEFMELVFMQIYSIIFDTKSTHTLTYEAKEQWKMLYEEYYKVYITFIDEITDFLSKIAIHDAQLIQEQYFNNNKSCQIRKLEQKVSSIDPEMITKQELQFSTLINLCDGCLNFSRLLAHTMHDDLENSRRLLSWFDKFQAAPSEHRYFNLLKVSYYLDIVSAQRSEFKVRHTFKSVTQDAHGKFYEQQRMLIDLSTLLAPVLGEFTTQQPSAAVLQLLWSQIHTYGKENEKTNISLQTYQVNHNLITQNFKQEQGFLLNDFIFMELKRLVEPDPQAFASFLIAQLNDSTTISQKQEAICKVYLTYLCFNQDFAYTDIRSLHRQSQSAFYAFYENQLFLVKQEKESLQDTLISTLEQPVQKMVNFILDPNYTVSEFVKNIVFINCSILKNTLQTQIQSYFSFLNYVNQHQTTFSDKKNQWYLSVDQFYDFDKVGTKLIADSMLTKTGRQILETFQNFNEILLELVEYFNHDSIEGNVFLRNLNLFEITDQNQPDKFLYFLENTKKISTKNSLNILSVILDVTHAFSFIRSDQWTEDNLIGKCYSRCILLVKKILYSICDHNSNLRNQIDEQSCIKNQQLYFQNLNKFRIKNKIQLNNELIFEIVRLQQKAQNEWSNISKEQAKDLTILYNLKSLGRLFQKVLDEADQNRRTKHQNNIVVNLKDIIKPKLMESKPQILVNLVEKLAQFLQDSFEKATFENESKQINFILEAIQQEYFNQDAISKHIGTRSSGGGILDLVQSNSWLEKEVKRHLLALFNANQQVLEAVFNLIQVKDQEKRLVLTSQGLCPLSYEFINYAQKLDSDVCDYMIKWLSCQVKHYRTDLVQYALQFFQFKYKNFYQHYDNYEKLGLGNKQYVKFKIEKIDEIFKAFEFIYQDKFQSDQKYKIIEDIRKIIEYLLKFKQSISILSEFEKSDQRLFSDRKELRILQNLELNQVQTFLQYQLQFFCQTKTEAHNEHRRVCESWLKCQKELEGIISHQGHPDLAMNFSFFAVDTFSLLFRRARKLEIKLVSPELRKLLKTLSGVQASQVCLNTRTKKMLVHKPLSPHTVHTAHQLLLKEGGGRPKFKKPHEVHLPYDDSDAAVVHAYDINTESFLVAKEHYFKTVVNKNYSVNFKVLQDQILMDELDSIARYYFESAKVIITEMGKTADSSTFYELSAHLQIQMKECSLKTNLIDLVQADFLTLYINCDIFAHAKHNPNLLRLWMEILNLLLIHSSQKGDILDTMFDKEPTNALVKMFVTNQQLIKNEYYRKAAFLIYAADNSFFSYKLPSIFKRLLENLRIEDSKIHSLKSDYLKYVELNLLILRVTYLKNLPKDLEVYWAETSELISQQLGLWLKREGSQKDLNLCRILSIILLFIEELFTIQNPDVSRQGFMYSFEMFGMPTEYSDDQMKDIYRSCQNLVQAAMKSKEAEYMSQQDTFQENNELYTECSKGYLGDQEGSLDSDEVVNQLNPNCFKLLDQLVKRNQIKFNVDWQKIHERLEREIIQILNRNN